MSIAFNVLTFINGCLFWRNLDGDNWLSCCVLSSVCWLVKFAELPINCELGFFNGETEFAERFEFDRRGCCLSTLDNELNVLNRFHVFNDCWVCCCWFAGWFNKLWLFVDQPDVEFCWFVDQFEVLNVDCCLNKAEAVFGCGECCATDEFDLLIVNWLLKLCVIDLLFCESWLSNWLLLVPVEVWLRYDIWLLNKSFVVDGTNELPKPFTIWFKLCCNNKFDWFVALSIFFASSFEIILLFKSVIDAAAYLSGFIFIYYWKLK